ncbi:SON protein [Gryllus bimaculatus]|nr:SON protein [Gryllus bimaculatus]
MRSASRTLVHLVLLFRRVSLDGSIGCRHFCIGHPAYIFPLVRARGKRRDVHIQRVGGRRKPQPAAAAATRAFYNPDKPRAERSCATPRHATPRHATPRLASPRLASPRLASPRLASPRLATVIVIASPFSTLPLACRIAAASSSRRGVTG